MSDLAALMQHAPGMAGYYIGRQQKEEAEQHQQKLMELAQLMQMRQAQEGRAAAKHPLEMEQMGLQNKTTNAQLPGIEADSTLKGVNARVAKAGEQDTIESNSMEAKRKAVSAAFNHLAPFLDVLETKAPPERHLTVDEIWKNAGMPDSMRGALTKKIAQIPADKLPQALRQINDNMLRNTPQYAQAYDTTSLQTDASIINNAADNRTNIRVAEINNEGRVRAAQEAAQRRMMTAEQRIAAARTAKERHAALIDAAVVADQSGDTEAASRYLQRAEAIRPQAEAELSQTQPQPGKVDVGGTTGLPTHPSKSIAPPSASGPKPGSDKPPSQTIPQGAIDKLKQNPQLREAFDQKYGAGAAAKVLGK